MITTSTQAEDFDHSEGGGMATGNLPIELNENWGESLMCQQNFPEDCRTLVIKRKCYLNFSLQIIKYHLNQWLVWRKGKGCKCPKYHARLMGFMKAAPPHSTHCTILVCPLEPFQWEAKPCVTPWTTQKAFWEFHQSLKQHFQFSQKYCFLRPCQTKLSKLS